MDMSAAECEVTSKPPAYYMGTPGAPSTLPRGPLMRAYSPASGAPVPVDRIKTLPGGAGAPPKPMRAYGGTGAPIRGGSERCFSFTPSSIDAIRTNDQLYNLPADRIHNDGYMSSPERGSRGAYEEPYYTQYVGAPPTRTGLTPVIDEEGGDPSMIDEQYALYSLKLPPSGRPGTRGPTYDSARLNPHANEDMAQRMRVENMERQLANLTGLVQKALQTPGGPQQPAIGAPPYASRLPASTSQDAVDHFTRTERPPKLGKGRYQKSVSFEKSVSFSDEPPDMNSPKQHSPQHAADTKPSKPAIKSSTLPRTSSQERDRLKPAPPPKPACLVSQMPLIMPGNRSTPPMAIDSFNQLKALQKQCKDLRLDMRNLRRLTLMQAHSTRQLFNDAFVKIRNATTSGINFGDPDFENTRACREEELYKQDMLVLESDLFDLEATVERLRGKAANRETRVNMADVEKIAMVLSKSSKTVADWKLKFPSLQESMKAKLSNEMEKVVRKEKMLEEEPERLELALRRCKKLTGTLVTLKRLACVQEQRLPCSGQDGVLSGRASPVTTPGDDLLPELPVDEIPQLNSNGCNQNTTQMSTKTNGGRAVGSRLAPAACGAGPADVQRPENALDALLDELQTFARPPPERSPRDTNGMGSLRRLHSYPSESETDASPPVRPRGQPIAKPPIPERHPELLALAGRRAPPPPPPRTTSRSPLASPTLTVASHIGESIPSPSNSSSCESVNSQEGCTRSKGLARHEVLEQRHRELLKKQRALQEQYARLQMIQRGSNSPSTAEPDLKKTGSESNLLTKMNLNMAPATSISGSLTHLAQSTNNTTSGNNTHLEKIPCTHDTTQTKLQELAVETLNADSSSATVSKIYETDIL